MYIKILDERTYTKKERALRKYFMKAYKYLIFKAVPTLHKENKKDGLYELDLPSDLLFERVYGKLRLLFKVEKDVAIIEDILPNDILMACFARELPIYKGVPYNTRRDLEKIKIAEKLLWMIFIMKKNMGKDLWVIMKKELLKKE